MLITEYVDKALEYAQYSKDENGAILAIVTDTPGFFSQGETYEEARDNLKDAIEGNVIISLKMGFDLPVFGKVKFDTSKKKLAAV